VLRVMNYGLLRSDTATSKYMGSALSFPSSSSRYHLCFTFPLKSSSLFRPPSSSGERDIWASSFSCRAVTRVPDASHLPFPLPIPSRRREDPVTSDLGTLPTFWDASVMLKIAVPPLSSMPKRACGNPYLLFLSPLFPPPTRTLRPSAAPSFSRRGL